jgi:hypothetical protein
MGESEGLILGVLGASAVLAGLLLVFGGVLLAQAASFPREADPKLVERYRAAGRWAVAPFLGFLITLVLAVTSLRRPSLWLPSLDVFLFLITVVLTGFYGLVVTRRSL